MFTEDSISLVSGFLLLCLFLLGAWALSRFIGKYGRAFQKGRYMKVVDSIQITQDRQLFILCLEKEDRCLLLASGPEGCNLISELKADYPVAAALPGMNPIEEFLLLGRKKAGVDFSHIFRGKAGDGKVINDEGANNFGKESG